MNVMITKNKNGTITVSVTVDPVGLKGSEEFVDTKMIKNHLDSKNISYGECLKSSVVANTSSKLMGEWIFEDLKSKTIVESSPLLEMSEIIQEKPKKTSKLKEKSE